MTNCPHTPVIMSMYALSVVYLFVFSIYAFTIGEMYWFGFVFFILLTILSGFLASGVNL